MDRIRTDSLRLMLQHEVTIAFIRPDAPCFFPTLYYATPVSEHPLAKSPLALDYAAREVLSSLYGGGKSAADVGAQRLFVERQSLNGRVLLNALDVRGRMVELGFTAIDPETMSFEDQVRAFSQASVVVGQMGAGMTTSLFCRPTTAVIHLAPHGWQEPFYFDLAVVRGHRYRVLFGDTGTDDRQPHFRDFRINLEDLAGAIHAL